MEARGRRDRVREAPASPDGEEIRKRGAYAFPPASQKLLPRLAPPFRYGDGSQGEVDSGDGLVRAKVALVSGPGSYWVLVYAAPGSVEGRKLGPITAVRIVAE